MLNADPVVTFSESCVRAFCFSDIMVLCLNFTQHLPEFNIRLYVALFTLVEAQQMSVNRFRNVK